MIIYIMGFLSDPPRIVVLGDHVGFPPAPHESHASLSTRERRYVAFVDNVMSLDRADFSVGRPVDVMFPQRENGTVRSVNFHPPRPGQVYPDRCVSSRIYQRNPVIVSSVHISLY